MVMSHTYTLGSKIYIMYMIGLRDNNDPMADKLYFGGGVSDVTQDAEGPKAASSKLPHQSQRSGTRLYQLHNQFVSCD